jgi:hypothetical protein
MRNIVPTLFLLFWLQNDAQTVPADWRIVTDAKRVCQIAVPPEWVPLPGSPGAVVLHDPSTAIAVVTSQPGQAFKPLTQSLRKLFETRGEKMLENSAKRILYKDRTSRNPDDPSAYSASVPGKGGTCSCRVLFLPSVSADIVKQITLSLGPVRE